MLTLSPAAAIYILCVTAVTGLVMGSFCNAWAWRLSNGESISKGRSHCADCGHTLAAKDLIPLLSYLFLKGRCRYCGKHISLRYPAAELISAVYFVTVVLRFDIAAPLVTLRWLLLGCLLLTASLTDLETQELPDRLTAGIVLLFVVFVPLSEGLQGFKNGILGALPVGLSLFIIVLLADKLMGRETMGGGDIKLVAALGLHFGPAKMLLLLLLACILGIIASAIGKKWNVPFPFGPSLAIAAWFTMLLGEQLINLYLSFF
ncbi:MAG: prepilin peptidase [Hydrogenoanaerobacterium sp.]